MDELTRLIIVPSGALHHVPFEALLDENGAHLITKASIVVAPSASVWKVLQTRTSTSRSWVGFVDPAATDPKWPPLQFAIQEAKWIAGQFPQGSSRVFARDQATWSNLRMAASGAGYLHFATHGEFPGDDALDVHSLLIAPEQGRAPALPAADVRTLDLRSSQLVALSVCNGGLYRTGPANEPYGLMPAFLKAGAQNVLGTRWPMDDQFGRDFMIEFYKHVVSHGPAVAHQLASKRFIADGELLRHWAGFVLVGSGR